MDPQHKALLDEALALAKIGDTEQARRLVEQVLEEDETNVRAWTLLYRVTSDKDEKRLALTTILEIDPGNQRAQELLEKLDGKALHTSEDEVAPGISRQQVLMLGGIVGIVLIAVILLIILVFQGRANQELEQMTLEAQIAMNDTATFIAPTIARQTEQAIFAAETATQFAVASPTLTPSETVPGPPTLPPTFTPTFTITPQVSPTPLPFPPASGQIIGWGGFDASQDGYLNILSIPVTGGEPLLLTDTDIRRGEYAHAVSLSEIVYTRYFNETFAQELVFVNGVGGDDQLLLEITRNSAQSYQDSTMAEFSADGNRMVFVALSYDTNTNEVFLYDRLIGGNDPLIRLTNDDKNYEFPTISPDGSTVIVARSDFNLNVPNRDLYRITIDNRVIEPLTTDGDAVYETMPRYSPDAQVLAYVTRLSTNDPGELVIRPVNAATVLQITNNPGADDIFPVFSPDGRFIAFASNRAGNYQIYAYDTSDGAIYQITQGETEEFYPGAWLR